MQAAFITGPRQVDGSGVTSPTTGMLTGFISASYRVVKTPLTLGGNRQMSKRNFVVGSECSKLLEEAVQKNLMATITNKHDNKYQLYKSSFLDSSGNCIVLTVPANHLDDGCPVEIVPGQEIAVSFKKGYNKCLFCTRVAALRQFELEPGLLIPAVAIYRPDQIERIQRRAYNRATPPVDMSIAVTFQPTSDSDKPSAKGNKNQYHGVLADMSAGGIGLMMRPTAGETLPDLPTNTQYKMEFTPLPGQEPLQLQVRFRQTCKAPDGHNVRFGFQIVGLEMTQTGRDTLRRIGRVVHLFERQQHISQHPYLT
jgi:c-di-GMP-binding flagellar brake protein YcgR